MLLTTIAGRAASAEWRTTYINTHNKLSDILTKNLPSGEKRSKSCKQVLHLLITENCSLGELVAAAAVVRVPLEWINAIVEYYG